MLDHLCEVYTISYTHQAEYTVGYMKGNPAVLTSTYFIAKDIKITQPESFAKLQGNHNVLLIDGRFKGVALKVIQGYESGDKLTIQAVSITEPRQVGDTILNYTVRDN